MSVCAADGERYTSTHSEAETGAALYCRSSFNPCFQVARNGHAPSECLSALVVVCAQKSVQKLSNADSLVQKMEKFARRHLNGGNDELALAAQLLLERLPQPKTQLQEYFVE